MRGGRSLLYSYRGVASGWERLLFILVDSSGCVTVVIDTKMR